jgi:hypothetical protein
MVDLAAQVGRYRSALQTWLSQATPDERERDLLQVFRRLLAESADPNLPPHGGGDSLDGS